MAKNGDWRSIENDREKYAAYLCSREWAEKREAVRTRASNRCERCKLLPMEACHHLTYERKYAERLEDLQAICNPCHEFTHGKSDFDPQRYHTLLSYLRGCKIVGRNPIPSETMHHESPRSGRFFGLVRSLEVLDNLRNEINATGSFFYAQLKNEDEELEIGEVICAVESVMEVANSKLPWEHAAWMNYSPGAAPIKAYRAALAIVGLPSPEELSLLLRDPEDLK